MKRAVYFWILMSVISVYAHAMHGRSSESVSTAFPKPISSESVR